MFDNYYGGWEEDEDEDEEEEFIIYDGDGNEIVDVALVFQSLMEPGANIKDAFLGYALSLFVEEVGLPELEEDGLPSKAWLVDALDFYTSHCLVQQEELLCHSRFENSLLMQMWQGGCLQRVGTGAGRFN